MTRPELCDVLTALVDAVDRRDGALSVVEITLDVPMEISVHRVGTRLLVRAAPGHTRFVSGFLPPVYGTQLRIVTEASP